MKIFKAEQIRACDMYTIAHEPIASIDLMERAANALYKWLVLHFSKNNRFALFAGPGNNGGDALALARLLVLGGYTHTQIYFLSISKSVSVDCIKNYDRLLQLDKLTLHEIHQGDNFPEILEDTVVIDGIFGSGLSRKVDGYWGNLIRYLNQLKVIRVAIDLPSGLFSENNFENNGTIFKANYTLSFQFPKLAFFFAENYLYVGKWEILDIDLSNDFIDREPTNYFLVQQKDLLGAIKKRTPFSHKGTFGHAFLIAGGFQKMGAAVLAAKACLRSGIGLLTVHVPETGYQIMQTAVPEAMLCIDESEFNYCKEKELSDYSAIGIGPGIGKKASMQMALIKILESGSHPIVIDADALNILAENPEWISKLPENAILTPHPGEFDRLMAKKATCNERLLTQIEFSAKYKVIIVLKGAFTSISLPNGKVYFNSTGNPGMATAGSGDVLTGIILAFLAQGYEPHKAALLGVFIHGLAGDYAAESMGQESLIASDIIFNLGHAFNQLKK